MDERARDVLTFWFEESTPKQWFAKDDAFDAAIRERFGDVQHQASNGMLDHWAETPDGAFALIIVLDQFSRNLYRNDARAFADDAKARGILRDMLIKGWDQEIAEDRRAFLYLPFEHSEALADQERSVELFATLGEENLRYAVAHKELIERFGRFPHRNAALGRESTQQEKDYLSKPGAGF